VTFGAGYTWYHFSGAKTLVNTAHQTSQYFEQTAKQLKEKTPEPNEALKFLRETAESYAKFIPGASAIVGSTFDDIDTIREKNGDKVDKIVREAYGELKDASSGGLNVATATKIWEIIQKYSKEIGGLAGDSASEIINNHPYLKEKVGGNIDQLKQLGDKLGPEAKKQVDQTWDQIRDITKNGLNADTVSKIQKLVQEKSQQLQKLGDEAWKKGLDQAKPYFDKNPKLKSLIMDNVDSLKQGNVGELMSKVKDAAESGNTDDIQDYIKSTVDKAKKSGSGGGSGNLSSYLNMIPGGAEIMPKLSQLQDVAQKHGKEAEQLFEETIKEIGQVLSKASDKGEKLAKKAKEDAK